MVLAIPWDASTVTVPRGTLWLNTKCKKCHHSGGDCDCYKFITNVNSDLKRRQLLVFFVGHYTQLMVKCWFWLVVWILGIP